MHEPANAAPAGSLDEALCPGHVRLVKVMLVTEELDLGCAVVNDPASLAGGLERLRIVEVAANGSGAKRAQIFVPLRAPR